MREPRPRNTRTRRLHDHLRSIIDQFLLFVLTVLGLTAFVTLGCLVVHALLGLPLAAAGAVESTDLDHPTHGGIREPLQAFNCTEPMSIRPVTHARILGCAKPIRVHAQRNATFQLLSRERQETATGYSCSILDSRTVSYCGNYDHQTRYPKHEYDSKPLLVPEATCREMYQHHMYTDPAGDSHNIAVPGVTDFHWEEYGHTYSEDSEVKCKGTSARFGNEMLDDVVVSHTYRITIEREKMVHRGADVIAHGPQLYLACSWGLGTCQTATTRYVWKPLANYCELAVTRTISGILVTDDEGQDTFMSTDGSLTRLVLGSPVQYCGRVVRGTNYNSLFLYSLDQARPFTRTIDPSSASLHTYVKNRDDFLYHTIANSLRDELGAVLRDNCEKRMKDARFKFFLQHANDGLTSYNLGNGTFATPGGEALYYYACPAVRVQAVESYHCYNALPVRPFPRGTIPTEEIVVAPDLFMAPLTHRLTHHAVRIPCSETFQPLYRTERGYWIKATPSLQEAKTPLTPTVAEPLYTRLPDLDFSKGGIYTEQELERMETLLEMPRLKDALGYIFAGQTKVRPGAEFVTPRDVFPHVTPASWFAGLTRHVLDFLAAWGDLAAICVSMWMIVRLITTMVEWFYTAKFARTTHNVCNSIMWGLCPTLLLMRQYRPAPPTPPGDSPDHIQLLDRDERVRQYAESQRTSNNTTMAEEVALLQQQLQDSKISAEEYHRIKHAMERFLQASTDCADSHARAQDTLQPRLDHELERLQRLADQRLRQSTRSTATTTTHVPPAPSRRSSLSLAPAITDMPGSSFKRGAQRSSLPHGQPHPYRAEDYTGANAAGTLEGGPI